MALSNIASIDVLSVLPTQLILFWSHADVLKGFSVDENGDHVQGQNLRGSRKRSPNDDSNVATSNYNEELIPILSKIAPSDIDYWHLQYMPRYLGRWIDWDAQLRVPFAVISDLEPNSRYVVRIRAHSHRLGWGLWFQTMGEIRTSIRPQVFRGIADMVSFSDRHLSNDSDAPLISSSSAPDIPAVDLVESLGSNSKSEDIADPSKKGVLNPRSELLSILAEEIYFVCEDSVRNLGLNPLVIPGVEASTLDLLVDGTLPCPLLPLMSLRTILPYPVANDFLERSSSAESVSRPPCAKEVIDNIGYLMEVPIRYPTVGKSMNSALDTLLSKLREDANMNFPVSDDSDASDTTSGSPRMNSKQHGRRSDSIMSDDHAFSSQSFANQEDVELDSTTPTVSTSSLNPAELKQLGKILKPRENSDLVPIEESDMEKAISPKSIVEESSTVLLEGDGSNAAEPVVVDIMFSTPVEDNTPVSCSRCYRSDSRVSQRLRVCLPCSRRLCGRCCSHTVYSSRVTGEGELTIQATRVCLDCMLTTASKLCHSRLGQDPNTTVSIVPRATSTFEADSSPVSAEVVKSEQSSHNSSSSGQELVKSLLPVATGCLVLPHPDLNVSHARPSWMGLQLLQPTTLLCLAAALARDSLGIGSAAAAVKWARATRWTPPRLLHTLREGALVLSQAARIRAVQMRWMSGLSGSDVDIDDRDLRDTDAEPGTDTEGVNCGSLQSDVNQLLAGDSLFEAYKSRRAVARQRIQSLLGDPPTVESNDPVSDVTTSRGTADNVVLNDSPLPIEKSAQSSLDSSVVDSQNLSQFLREPVSPEGLPSPILSASPTSNSVPASEALSPSRDVVQSLSDDFASSLEELKGADMPIEASAPTTGPLVDELPAGEDPRTGLSSLSSVCIGEPVSNCTDIQGTVPPVKAGVPLSPTLSMTSRSSIDVSNVPSLSLVVPSANSVAPGFVTVPISLPAAATSANPESALVLGSTSSSTSLAVHSSMGSSQLVSPTIDPAHAIDWSSLLILPAPGTQVSVVAVVEDRNIGSTSSLASMDATSFSGSRGFVPRSPSSSISSLPTVSDSFPGQPSTSSTRPRPLTPLQHVITRSASKTSISTPQQPLSIAPDSGIAVRGPVASTGIAGRASAHSNVSGSASQAGSLPNSGLGTPRGPLPLPAFSFSPSTAVVGCHSSSSFGASEAIVNLAASSEASTHHIHSPLLSSGGLGPRSRTDTLQTVSVDEGMPSLPSPLPLAPSAMQLPAHKLNMQLPAQVSLPDRASGWAGAADSLPGPDFLDQTTIHSGETKGAHSAAAQAQTAQTFVSVTATSAAHYLSRFSAALASSRAVQLPLIVQTPSHVRAHATLKHAFATVFRDGSVVLPPLHPAYELRQALLRVDSPAEFVSLLFRHRGAVTQLRVFKTSAQSCPSSNSARSRKDSAAVPPRQSAGPAWAALECWLLQRQLEASHPSVRTHIITKSGTSYMQLLRQAKMDLTREPGVVVTSGHHLEECDAELFASFEDYFRFRCTLQPMFPQTDDRAVWDFGEELRALLDVDMEEEEESVIDSGASSSNSSLDSNQIDIDNLPSTVLRPVCTRLEVPSILLPSEAEIYASNVLTSGSKPSQKSSEIPYERQAPWAFATTADGVPLTRSGLRPGKLQRDSESAMHLLSSGIGGRTNGGANSIVAAGAANSSEELLAQTRKRYHPLGVNARLSTVLASVRFQVLRAVRFLLKDLSIMDSLESVVASVREHVFSSRGSDGISSAVAQYKQYILSQADMLSAMLRNAAPTPDALSNIPPFKVKDVEITKAYVDSLSVAELDGILCALIRESYALEEVLLVEAVTQALLVCGSRTHAGGDAHSVSYHIFEGPGAPVVDSVQRERLMVLLHLQPARWPTSGVSRSTVVSSCPLDVEFPDFDILLQNENVPTPLNLSPTVGLELGSSVGLGTGIAVGRRVCPLRVRATDIYELASCANIEAPMARLKVQLTHDFIFACPSRSDRALEPTLSNVVENVFLRGVFNTPLVVTPLESSSAMRHESIFEVLRGVLPVLQDADRELTVTPTGRDPGELRLYVLEAKGLGVPCISTDKNGIRISTTESSLVTAISRELSKKGYHLAGNVGGGTGVSEESALPSCKVILPGSAVGRLTSIVEATESLAAVEQKLDKRAVSNESPTKDEEKVNHVSQEPQTLILGENDEVMGARLSKYPVTASSVLASSVAFSTPSDLLTAAELTSDLDPLRRPLRALPPMSTLLRSHDPPALLTAFSKVMSNQGVLETDLESVLRRAIGLLAVTGSTANQPALADESTVAVAVATGLFEEPIRGRKEGRHLLALCHRLILQEYRSRLPGAAPAPAETLSFFGRLLKGLRSPSSSSLSMISKQLPPFQPLSILARLPQLQSAALSAPWNGETILTLRCGDREVQSVSKALQPPESGTVMPSIGTGSVDERGFRIKNWKAGIVLDWDGFSPAFLSLSVLQQQQQQQLQMQQQLRAPSVISQQKAGVSLNASGVLSSLESEYCGVELLAIHSPLTPEAIAIADSYITHPCTHLSGCVSLLSLAPGVPERISIPLTARVKVRACIAHLKGNRCTCTLSKPPEANSSESDVVAVSSVSDTNPPSTAIHSMGVPVHLSNSLDYLEESNKPSKIFLKDESHLSTSIDRMLVNTVDKHTFATTADINVAFSTPNSMDTYTAALHTIEDVVEVEVGSILVEAFYWPRPTVPLNPYKKKGKNKSREY